MNTYCFISDNRLVTEQFRNHLTCHCGKTVTSFGLKNNLNKAFQTNDSRLKGVDVFVLDINCLSSYYLEAVFALIRQLRALTPAKVVVCVDKNGCLPGWRQNGAALVSSGQRLYYDLKVGGCPS